jgi:molybdenum cofactor guanylyltransferase
LSVVGAIIAGGASRRFGSDKARALLCGKPLIDHVIDSLLPQISALIIVGRTWPQYPCVDDYPFSCGPLSGLCAAMRWANENDYDHVLTAGCDVLPIPDDLGRLLGGDGPAVVAGQRLLGLWPATLAETLETHIRTQCNYALSHWVAISGAREMRSRLAFHNLNRAEDLAVYANGL